MISSKTSISLGFGVLLVAILLLSSCGQPTLERIEIEPSSPTLSLGQTLQFHATGRDPKGNPIEDIVFSWSAEGAAGRIDDQGLFTALQAGEVRVKVASEAIRASALVTVERDKVASIRIVSASREITVGESVVVTVTAQNAATVNRLS